MEKVYFYETKLGKVRIAEDGEGITELSLLPVSQEVQTNELDTTNFELEATELLNEAAKQFNEYLNGSRTEFTVKLNPKGTEFQKKVWTALRAIPYGETRSYKQIAETVGNEKASRAVGMANHNNPVMCMIPCHRVIGANGKLVGYAGGLDIKEKLLNLEKEKGRTQ